MQAQLDDLKRDHGHVRISSAGLEWILTLECYSECFRREYRGANLAHLTARAWAGERPDSITYL